MMNPRSGLRVRSEKGVHPNVREACLHFAVWLRLNMEFPIRVVVYLKKSYQIKTIDTKEMVSGTFFIPYSKEEEPYIRIATGDYEELVMEIGEENAIFAILNTMAHELIHYQQWVEDRDFDKNEAENEAEEESSKVVLDYYEGRTFFEEVVEQQKVWTIFNEKGNPLATNSDGEFIMPFWSNKIRAEKIINIVPAYRDYKIEEIPLSDFLNTWIKEMKKDNLLMGINWSGKCLLGKEMQPDAIFERIQEQIKIKC